MDSMFNTPQEVVQANDEAQAEECHADIPYHLGYYARRNGCDIKRCGDHHRCRDECYEHHPQRFVIIYTVHGI